MTQLCNIMEKVPNFVLYMLFIPLGSKLKEVTGYDMIDTELSGLMENLKTPCYFLVGDDDKICGKDNVKMLYNKCGGRPGLSSPKQTS